VHPALLTVEPSSENDLSMPSSWTHAMTAVAIGSVVAPRPVPRGTWGVIAILAIAPDLDAIGRPFGRGDVEFLGGHRALTHSLTFTLVVTLVVFAWLRRRAAGEPSSWRLWLALFLATTSHAVLDAFTQYGSGIQFLAPWSTERFASPWRPIRGFFLLDTLIFVLAFIATRLVLHRRGIPVPRALALGADRGTA
jgi:inner membrane protein